MNPTPITRRTLVDEACARLRDEIIGRRLGGGQRLTETELAERLGISRTPLRAALSRLAHEGFVEIEPGRGVRVAPDGAEVVREVYPILATLDGAALEQAVAAGACDTARLAELHASLKPGLPRARLFALDHGFHAELRKGCPNRRLLELIERHLLLAARFDGAAARGMHAVDKSTAEHTEILKAVTRGRAAEARALLEAHWLGGIEVVVEWLAKEAPDARKRHDR